MVSESRVTVIASSLMPDVSAKLDASAVVLIEGTKVELSGTPALCTLTVAAI
jgi:hypothetical protein